MFKLSFFNTVCSNEKIDLVEEIEKDNKRAALKFIAEAVRNEPHCKTYRFHMGRIASELKQTSDQNESSKNGPRKA